MKIFRLSAGMKNFQRYFPVDSRDEKLPVDSRDGFLSMDSWDENFHFKNHGWTGGMHHVTEGSGETSRRWQNGQKHLYKQFYFYLWTAGTFAAFAVEYR